MKINDFKNMFGEVAKQSGFKKAFEGWFKESAEVIHVLELQKSNFGNYYYLNIKLFIQGAYGKHFSISKDLVKNMVGNIFERQPEIYSYLFDLDNNMEPVIRENGIRKLFTDFIVLFSNKTSTKNGIMELNKKGELFILPGLKNELENL